MTARIAFLLTLIVCACPKVETSTPDAEGRCAEGQKRCDIGCDGTLECVGANKVCPLCEESAPATTPADARGRCPEGRKFCDIGCDGTLECVGANKVCPTCEE